MKLANTRCKCAACGEYFNSTTAFDKHRKGDFGNPGDKREQADFVFLNLEWKQSEWLRIPPNFGRQVKWGQEDGARMPFLRNFAYIA